jgi:hypothetical protein
MRVPATGGVLYSHVLGALGAQGKGESGRINNAGPKTICVLGQSIVMCSHPDPELSKI